MTLGLLEFSCVERKLECIIEESTEISVIPISLTL